MKLENIKIYDLEESLVASGYPMRTELTQRKADEKDVRRGLNLTKASNGNGAHGQWLTGVRVAFDLTCTNKMWVEAERYRFLEFVSSQSTMHRITKFNLDEQYNEYVDPRVIEIMQNKVDTPSMIAAYTYELCKTFNGYYHDHSILREENEAVKRMRLALAQQVARVINRSMRLLGIDVPERM